MNVLQPILRPLALRCVEHADRHGRTPVIVTDPGLTLAPEFFAALAGELHAIVERPLRIEFLIDLERVLSLWRSASVTRRVERVRAALSPQLAQLAVVDTRAVLSRPAGPRRPLVVGFSSSGGPLPLWAASVRVTCRPAALDDFQLIPHAA